MAREFLTLEETRQILKVSYPTVLKLAQKLDSNNARKSGATKTSGWEISRDAIQAVINQERKELEEKQKRLNDI